jgi:hypothetical protein
VGALKVNLDWPTPDEVDLYVYYRNPDGRLVEVGSSGEFVLSKEEALIELPEPGDSCCGLRTSPRRRRA